MNPAGIAYFYGALDPATAAVEADGGDTYAAVATFQPTRPLRLVDLTKLELPSPFDDLGHAGRSTTVLFLRSGSLATSPSRSSVTSGYIEEYVPTQAVTEYIRFLQQAAGWTDCCSRQPERAAQMW